MDVHEALSIAARNAGLSSNQLSRRAGKSDAYIAAAKSRNSIYRADILAGLAEPAGYCLALIPREDVPASALIIDGPKEA